MRLFNFLKPKRKIESHVYDSIKTVESREEVPVDTGNTIFLVGCKDFYKWAIFTCPEGHRRIEVNLMRSGRPNWKLSFLKNKISLYPSIVVNDPPCDCHFWLKENIAYKAYFY